MLAARRVFDESADRAPETLTRLRLFAQDREEDVLDVEANLLVAEQFADRLLVIESIALALVGDDLADLGTALEVLLRSPQELGERGAALDKERAKT